MSVTLLWILFVAVVFRRDKDGWKLLYRHAHQMTGKQQPSGAP